MERKMGLARFIAKDPYKPAATRAELDDLLVEMHGIINWKIGADGEVTVEYDPVRISDQVIEEALDGMGFKLQHIFDKPHASDAEVHQAGFK